MKKSQLAAWSTTGVILLLILFTGCASSGLTSMTPHERVAFEEVMRENMTPSEMIHQAEQKLAEATKADLAFYAPHAMETAKSLLDKANAMLVKKGAKPEEVILVAIKAKQAVASGLDTKTQVTEVLAISLAEKQRLDDLDAHAFFPSEYDLAVGVLEQMIALIEGKKPEEATGMQTLFTEKASALLIKTLVQVTLDESRKVLADAQSKEAKRYAPTTFEAASLLLKQTETFIRTYPRDRDGIKKMGAETLQAATHALTVTHQVKMLEALETGAIEGFVLSIEKQIHHVGEALGQPSIPYDTLRTQLQGLVESAEKIAATAALVPGLEKVKEALTTDLGTEKEKIASLEKEFLGLQVSLASLTKDKEQGDEANTSLNQDNTALKTQVDTLNQSLSEKQKAEETLAAEKALALEKVTQLKRAITELELKLRDAETGLAQAEALTTKIQTLETANKGFEEKIAGLQADKNRGLDEVASLKETVKTLKTELEHKATDLKQTEKRAEEAASLTATTNS